MNTQTESPTRLHGRWILDARLAWLLFTLTCIWSALSIVFLALSWETPVPDTWGFRGDAMLLALAFGSIGLLLARRHLQNPIGWLLLLAGLINSILEFCVEYAAYALLTKSGALPYGTLAAWTASWIWVAAIGTLIYSFLLFPTGHLPSDRWRPVAWFFVGAFGLLTFVFMIRPGSLYFAPYLDNPFAVQVAYRVLSPIPVAAATAIFLVGISVILRLRRAEGVGRQQLKWFAYAAMLRVIFGISESVAEALGLKGADPKVFQYLSVAIWIAIAVTIAFAILRYRLWDNDILINRTLVYGTLTASVVALYVLTVGGSSIVLQTQSTLPGFVIAILAIAFLFQPLRQRLQVVADRLVPVPKATISQSISSPVPQTKPEPMVVATTSAPDTTLHGQWLLIARLAWIAMFTVLTAMYALGFLAVRDTLSTVCQEERCTLRQQIQHTDKGDKVLNWPGPPVGYADRLRPDQVVALERLGLTLDQYGWLAALQMGIPALVLLLIAAGLFWWKSNDWMVLFASVMVATFPLHNTPLPFTLMVHQPAWEWVYHSTGVVAFSCLMIFPLIFPNGQFVPRWTRWMALYGIAGAFMGVFLGSTILEVLGGFAGRVFIGVVVLLPSFGTGVFAQLYRYFRVARTAERQQIKWVVVGVVGLVVTQFAVLIPLNALLTSPVMSTDPARALVLSAIPDTLWHVNLLFIPICIAISVLRYRLWDIDLVINRTLVYGALTASVVGLYILIVGWLSIGLQTNNLPASLFAILVIALLFQPLRRRLQDIANRFVPVPQSTLALEQHDHKPTGTEGQGAADTRLRGRWPLLARLAWVAGFTMLTLVYALGFLAVQNTFSTVCEEELCTLRQQVRRTDAGEQIVGWPGPPIGYADPLRPDQVEALERLGLTLAQYGRLGALQMGIPALVCLLIAAGLFWRKPDDWMVLFVSVMVATYPLQDMPLPFTLAVRQPAWEWAFDLASIVALSSFLSFPLIFPSGRFVPRWTRWMVLFVLAGAVIAILFRNSILEIPGAEIVVVVYLLISFGTGIYAQLYRYFRVASPIERQQLKWVIVGLVGFIGTTLAVLQPLDALLASPVMNVDPERALALSVLPDTLFRGISLFIPVSIAISVLRYRLWDIDIIINRTLVYGALTGMILGAFVVIVGLISITIQSSGNSIIAIIATGLVALLFNPLRQRLQRGVNHLMYGERDEPYAALSRLGRRLEASLVPEAVLPTVVTTVRETLKLPYVAIYLQQDSHGYQIVAEAASPSLRIKNGRIRVPGMEREGRCIPLIHQGETVGYIVLGPRAPNEAFSTTDLRLLEDLAPQVGVAVHAVRLTADLQRSREQLVLAREEERRRLRRDLHDGLGPQLAGLALKLETLRNRLRDDPLADSLLADLAKRTQDATADIRHLVYELRPPTLDEFGLVMALRESVAQFTQQGCNDLNITFDAPESLPPLPAAVEVAVFRIVQEALMNVIRHAEARNCLVRLTLDESSSLLCVEVRDDGKGLPMKRRAGVGLNSMRERAEELGGTLTITPIPTGGTSLLARLPCRLNGPAHPTDQKVLDAPNKEV